MNRILGLLAVVVLLFGATSALSDDPHTPCPPPEAVQCIASSRAILGAANAAAKLAVEEARNLLIRTCPNEAALANQLATRLRGPFVVCKLQKDGKIGKCFGRRLFVPLGEVQ